MKYDEKAQDKFPIFQVFSVVTAKPIFTVLKKQKKGVEKKKRV